MQNAVWRRSGLVSLKDLSATIIINPLKTKGKYQITCNQITCLVMYLYLVLVMFHFILFFSNNLINDLWTMMTELKSLMKAKTKHLQRFSYKIT